MKKRPGHGGKKKGYKKVMLIIELITKSNSNTSEKYISFSFLL